MIMLLLFGQQQQYLLTAGDTPKFTDFLSSAEKRIRQRRYLRAVILPPKRRPETRVMLSRDDSALITLTSLDHRAFQYLLQQYAPVYNAFTPYKSSERLTG